MWKRCAQIAAFFSREGIVRISTVRSLIEKVIQLANDYVNTNWRGKLTIIENLGAVGKLRLKLVEMRC